MKKMIIFADELLILYNLPWGELFIPIKKKITNQYNISMKKKFIWLLIATLSCCISVTTVSCTSDDVNHSIAPSDQDNPTPAFFTDEINALIDANYPQVLANGYAELIIPSTMFDPNMMQYADYHRDVMKALNELGYKTYINGGAVRDAILGTSIHDLDLSTDATPEEMKEKLTGFNVTTSTTSGGSIAKAYHANGDWTDMVPMKGVSEKLRGKPFIPANASFTTYSKNLIDDTYTRDLTINSLYYDFQKNLIIDYHGGLHDLRDKIIRTVYDANTMYPINPSSLIRTVRFAARYGFNIDKATTTAIKENMHYCKETYTGPYNNYYITKGFGDGCASRTYHYYYKYGIVDYFMPLLKGYAGKTTYETTTCKALDYAETQTKVTASLSMAALFLPVMQQAMTDKEKTLENITATWDSLEKTSGQDVLFGIDDYDGERTAMLNIFYVYFALTDASLKQEATKALKANKQYNNGVILVDAYKQ